MKINVLLIEDNRDDIFLMERAIQKAGVPWDLQIVTDGQQAVDYLQGLGIYSNRDQFPLPALIFVDLKLPYITGFEVMATVRTSPVLSRIPAIVLTSSPEERDQLRAMELGAKAYIIKPPAADLLVQIAENRFEELEKMDSASVVDNELIHKPSARIIIFKKNIKNSSRV